jgi:hypothetical protein
MIAPSICISKIVFVHLIVLGGWCEWLARCLSISGLSIALVCKVSTQLVKVAKWADLDLGCKRAVLFGGRGGA